MASGRTWGTGCPLSVRPDGRRDRRRRDRAHPDVAHGRIVDDFGIEGFGLHGAQDRRPTDRWRPQCTHGIVTDPSQPNIWLDLLTFGRREGARRLSASGDREPGGFVV